jgi:hypothetical protein
MKTIKFVILILIALMISGCSLAKLPEEKDSDIGKPKSDVVGIWIKLSRLQTFELSSSDSLTFITFQKEIINGVPSSQSQTSGAFYDTNMHIHEEDERSAFTFNSTVPLKANLNETITFYALIEDENGKIVLGDILGSYHVSGESLAKVNYSFVDESVLEGVARKEEMTFNFNFSYHRPIERTRLIELNENYSVIQTSDIQNRDVFQLNAKTNYFIIEQTTLDDAGNSDVTITSYIASQSDEELPIEHQFFQVEPDGTVRIKALKIQK